MRLYPEELGLISHLDRPNQTGPQKEGVFPHLHTPTYYMETISATRQRVAGALPFLDKYLVQDPAGGLLVLQRLFEQIKRSVHIRRCRLKLTWADGAYATIGTQVRKQFGWTIEIVRPKESQKGFKMLPRRWVVERTFGWLGRYR